MSEDTSIHSVKLITLCGCSKILKHYTTREEIYAAKKSGILIALSTNIYYFNEPPNALTGPTPPIRKFIFRETELKSHWINGEWAHEHIHRFEELPS